MEQTRAWGRSPRAAFLRGWPSLRQSSRWTALGRTSRCPGRAGRGRGRTRWITSIINAVGRSHTSRGSCIFAGTAKIARGPARGVRAGHAHGGTGVGHGCCEPLAEYALGGSGGRNGCRLGAGLLCVAPEIRPPFPVAQRAGQAKSDENPALSPKATGPATVCACTTPMSRTMVSRRSPRVRPYRALGSRLGEFFGDPSHPLLPSNERCDYARFELAPVLDEDLV